MTTVYPASICVPKIISPSLRKYCRSPKCLDVALFQIKLAVLTWSTLKSYITIEPLVLKAKKPLCRPSPAYSHIVTYYLNWPFELVKMGIIWKWFEENPIDFTEYFFSFDRNSFSIVPIVQKLLFDRKKTFHSRLGIEVDSVLRNCVGRIYDKFASLWIWSIYIASVSIIIWT